MRIAEAHSDDEITRCFAVMAQLRPHLLEAEFVGRVKRQMAEGFHLAYVEDEGRVVCVAGYRLMENLSWGKHLFLDDLITDAAGRSNGYGKAMLDWLLDVARRQGCAELHLESGVQRFAAHRFYLREGMDITCHHFAMRL